MSLNPNPITAQSALRFQRDGELYWQTQTADGQLQSEPVAKLLEQGHISQAQLLASGVVWVPTEQLVLTDIALPAKRRAEIDAALPYAMEEQLTQPVENYHFAILHKESMNTGSILQVAVVADSLMQTWKASLQEHKLEPLLLVADCFALPHTEDGAFCLAMNTDDDLQLCRSGAYAGAALPVTLQITKGVGNTTEISWLQAQWNKAVYDAVQWRELGALNLAQGKFSAHKEANFGKLWLWPNLAAGMLMATLLVSSYLQTEQIKQDTQAYNTQSEQLFRNMFPDVKRVVNLKAQTLSRLKNASSSEGLQLMPLVYQLEPLLAKNSAVQVEEVRWNQSAAQLQLRVSAPQSRQLQQLGQQLDAINGKLTIKNVTPEAALGVINVGTN
ncbi:Type II secretion system protein L [uncultured Thiomicrorhabdus sp.]